MKDIYSCCIFICATGADMANIHEAESSELISRVADKLKKEEIKKPAYIDYVKTGAGKERIPSSPDFWYIRCASILRQAYINGPIGVSKLRTRYGVRKRHLVHRHHHTRSGGSLIKDAFDALEKLGFVKKSKSGREITPKGRSLLDKAANEMLSKGS